jgi:hypothetical protein
MEKGVTTITDDGEVEHLWRIAVIRYNSLIRNDLLDRCDLDVRLTTACRSRVRERDHAHL